MSEFLTGSLVSVMFMEQLPSSEKYAWWVKKSVGLLAWTGATDQARSIFVAVTAFVAVGLIVVVCGIVYGFLNFLWARALYGKILPDRKARYWKLTIFVNSLLALSFYIIGFAAFMNSPSISFFGKAYGPEVFLFVFLVFFAVWWAQHLINQYACGIKITAETEL